MWVPVANDCQVKWQRKETETKLLPLYFPGGNALIKINTNRANLSAVTYDQLLGSLARLLNTAGSAKVQSG